ncbi:hypothetical protein LX59_02346 [Azomonas agilis]|uniref:Uncharacterized protein n=1 Tax=Azomonas agilis TaxID=116849 RepID=A0A562I016_9GAMM|nr:hypothetical protein LX59_02346 [Azomonas agilis]
METIHSGVLIPRKPRNQLPENMGIESHKTSELIPGKAGMKNDSGLGRVVTTFSDFKSEYSQLTHQHYDGWICSGEFRSEPMPEFRHRAMHEFRSLVGRNLGVTVTLA